jgi:hypothetical protein
MQPAANGDAMVVQVALLDRLLVRMAAGGHRCLLFSTMTQALDLLEEYLDWRGGTLGPGAWACWAGTLGPAAWGLLRAARLGPAWRALH